MWSSVTASCCCWSLFLSVFFSPQIQVLSDSSQGWRSRVSEESEVSSRQTDPQVNTGAKSLQKFSCCWIVFDCWQIWGCVTVLQGVTLTDLKEAQRTISLSPQDRQIEEGDTPDERSCLRKGWTDDTGAKTTECAEIKRSVTDEVSKRNSCKRQFPASKQGCFWVIFKFCLSFHYHGQQGNIGPRLETLPEFPTVPYSSLAASFVLPDCNNSFRGQNSTKCAYFTSQTQEG